MMKLNFNYHKNIQSNFDFKIFSQLHSCVEFNMLKKVEFLTHHIQTVIVVDICMFKFRSMHPKQYPTKSLYLMFKLMLD